MLTITIDPVVLEALQGSFPTPRTAAAKALNKYKALLEDLLFRAQLRGQTNYERLLNCYSIPVSTLVHKGPHIGYDKVRLHKWLADNQLDLIETVEKGSNLTGRVSMIKLTELVSIDHTTTAVQQALATVTTAQQLSSVLCADAQRNSDVFSALYPDYFSYLKHSQRIQVFDIAPVDIASLEAYVAWLHKGANMISPGRTRMYTEQAQVILSVARHTGGWFPQRKKLSAFGRTYYSGLSVQSVNKELRRAMLGDCWEYDIRSSVVTWKMTFAQELTDQLYPTQECRKLFWASILYLEDRADFMRDVRREMFAKQTKLSAEYQEKLIKEALTAISFGARAKGVGWTANDGGWTNPALVKIIKNGVQRAAFLNSPVIQQFLKEQSILDNYIAENMRNQAPMLYYGPLITRNIKPSKSKAVAFLYQHAEAQLMQIAIDRLSQQGIKPIALIHDAFIVRNKLSLSQRDEIHQCLRSSTENKFWFVKQTELEGYRYQ
ncbi:hypothetical protein [Limnohabitans sp. Hippo4]|uniref:hypothetical protein n=1 Tax=Limnohabitans sp. Hippo4 TaxID=1826167 RepID=UPI000D3596CE|nr:hypothetical protein [Limnohabitans sp. Hippo4]PUE36793.1 hypothetical protein B9Z46_08970 [Limnohabitans sp. Hippo4]